MIFLLRFGAKVMFPVISTAVRIRSLEKVGKIVAYHPGWLIQEYQMFHLALITCALLSLELFIVGDGMVTGSVSVLMYLVIL
jgi:hypothetical protein